MSWYEELNRRYQMASFAEAQRQNKEVQWWLKRIAFWSLKGLFLFPIKFIWEWTGRRTNDTIPHLIQFVFFLALFYCIIGGIILSPFMSK